MTDITKHKVLIVDDEEMIRELLDDVMQQAGYESLSVATGEQLFAALSEDTISLLIIDLRLNNEDGLTLARKVREQSAMPIIMLTGKGDEMDRILGLELVADDYLMKPFNNRELIARVNALIRRSTQLSQPADDDNAIDDGLVMSDKDCLFFGDLTLDLTARELLDAEGIRVDLTYGEYAILEVLASSPNKVFSRDELLELCRTNQTDVSDRTIDVQITRLRRKMEKNPKAPKYIRTQRGRGYIFSHPVRRNNVKD